MAFLASWPSATFTAAAPARRAPAQLAVAPESGDFGAVDLAVAQKGEAIAVWTRHSTLETSTSAAQVLRWTPSTELDEENMFQDTTLTASAAVDARGDVVAAWERTGGPQVIEVAVRPAHLGRWRAPVAVSAAPEPPMLGGDEAPRVAVGSNGQAVVVWVRHVLALGAETRVVEAAVGSVRTGRWGRPAVLSAPGVAAEGPQVAVDAHGGAAAVWEAFEGSQAQHEAGVVQTATRAATGGAWSAPTTISSNAPGQRDPQIGLDSTGDAVAVWQRADSPTEEAPATVEAAFGKVAGARWAHSRQLSPDGVPAGSPALAVNARGEAVALWERDEQLRNSIVEVSGSVRQDTFDAPIVLASWNHVAQPMTCLVGGIHIDPHPVRRCRARQLPHAEPQIALNGRGGSAALWRRADAFQAVIEAARRQPARPSWQSLGRISTDSASEARIGLDAAGRAVAIWRRLTECTLSCDPRETLEASVLADNLP
ncbi:MAG: hypothetical protein ABR992_13610 [Solirubrobacteraceae bacterium]